MSPTVWGPKVWFLLHRLSFYSDKVELVDAWKSMLLLLNNAIPCRLCRRHMRTYCLDHPLLFPRNVTGPQVREILIGWVYTFHNSVNARQKYEQFDYELLRFFYGIGSAAGAVADVGRVLKEIEDMWPPVTTKPWSTSVRHIMDIVRR